MTYAEWNEALAERFFPAGSANAPTYLAVSEDVLSNIGAPTAAEDLSRVVRERYLTPGGSLSGKRIREDLRWRPGGSPIPPYLGLLGLCVLAASQMASDAEAGIRSSNYYFHVNRLLGLDAISGAPSGFEELGSLWKDLDRWLRESGGDRGESTVSTHRTQVYIGYPMSQAIFPVRDRRRLPDFFVSAGLEPGQKVSSAELLTHLRRWAGPGSGLRELTMRRIADPDWEEMVSGIVLAEFSSWDGALRDASGRRRAEIALNVFVSAGGRRCEVYYVPKQPEGFPDEVTAGDLHLVSAGGGWYQPLPEHLVPDALARGVSLVSADGARSFSFEPRTIIPLHQSFNAGLGGWISVRRIHLHDPLRIVVHHERLAVIQEYLDRAGRDGTPRSAEGLPPGWLLLVDALVTSALAGPARGDPDLERILPRLATTMSFDGGLALESDCYLRGEEPVIHLGLEEPGVFYLDGESQELAAGGLSLPLSEIKPGLGHHRIGLGEMARRFVVSGGDAGPVPEGAGSLSFVMERHGSKVQPRALDPLPVQGAPSRGNVWVTGASIRGSEVDDPLGFALPLLLRRGHETVLVGHRPGELMESEEPPRPSWLDRIGPHAGSQFYEATCPFPAAFALYGSGVDCRVEALETPEGWDSLAPSANPKTTSGNLEADLAWARAIFGASNASVIPRSAAGHWNSLVELAFDILVASGG